MHFISSAVKGAGGRRLLLCAGQMHQSNPTNSRSGAARLTPSPSMCCGRTRCCRRRRRDSCSPEYDSAGARRQQGRCVIVRASSGGTDPNGPGLYHGRVLHQGHVVAAERHHKQHRPHVLEATDPLPPFGPLASDVVHPAHADQRQNSTAGKAKVPRKETKRELEEESGRGRAPLAARLSAEEAHRGWQLPQPASSAFQSFRGGGGLHPQRLGFHPSW